MMPRFYVDAAQVQPLLATRSPAAPLIS